MKKEFRISYQEFTNWKELSSMEQNIIEHALKVCQNAYAPYSNFKVGAAVLLSNGEVVLGSNQENMAYHSGLCAERVALFSAGAIYPKERVLLLAVVSEGDFSSADELLSPCGSCRQVMMESELRQGQTFKTILVSQNSKTLIFNSVHDLLPFGFRA